jgi:HEAT repeat protein
MKQSVKHNVNVLLLVSLSLTLIAACKRARADEVLHAPAEHLSFAQRLDWAESTVKANQFLNGYWIGYSIERYMYEDSRIGWCGRNDRDLPTLQELLLGKGRAGPDVVQERKMLTAVQKELQSVSADKTERRKILKEVGVLFRYPAPRADTTDFDKVYMSTLDCLVDLKALPLVWLGTVKDAKSIPFLDGLYESSQRQQCKRALMAAVSTHDTKSRVIPCLRKHVTQEDNVDLRCQAVFWLAQQDHRDAFDILKNVARNDASSKVRKDSVFWIGQKAKTDDLIELLETVALKDPVRDVRKKAVFALSQVPDERGVDALAKIARTEKDLATRKEAIFWLSQKASKKAMASLEEIAFDAEHTELQERAVFAISQWPKDQSIPALSKISRNHPNPNVRKKAIFWLGQTGDPRAVDTLVEIVRMSR